MSWSYVLWPATRLVVLCEQTIKMVAFSCADGSGKLYP